ncbi:MAG: S8 family serine peptidase [Salibacteraceae bacterium]
MNTVKNLILLISLIATSLNCIAQNRFIVFYKNKGDVSTASYTGLISNKSAHKRALHQIGFDFHDLPVSKKYIHTLRENAITIISSSKWLNASLIETNLSLMEVKKLNIPISKIQEVNSNNTRQVNKFKTSSITPKVNSIETKNLSGINYGLAQFQTEYYEMEYLHDKGFLGEGISMAFLDVGYDNMNNISQLSPTFSNNKVIDTYDFWDDSTYVYHKDTHGRGVSFIVLGNEPDTFVGMAPLVNTLLYITDDLQTETLQDEFNYVKALERADSIGVDIVNASLSYKIFDNPSNDYSYSDMDGNTAISTLGCNIAAQKGILIVNSAGNSGHIGAPADAIGILSVGGAAKFKSSDYISSTGPTADGRICPNIAGLTENANTIYGNSITGTYYMGTSTAAPFISGLAACLMEAHPTHSVSQIIDAIQQSANQAQNPDSLIGYGVPNARLADSILNSVVSVKLLNHNTSSVSVFPNPSTHRITVASETLIQKVEIYSVTGQLIQTHELNQESIHLHIGSKGVFAIRTLLESGKMEYNTVVIH